MCVITHPFAIDGHVRIVVDSQVLDFRDGPNALHIRGITASTEDHRDTRLRVDVRRSNERSGSVIDECC